jgi:hypothetical protein
VDKFEGPFAPHCGRSDFTYSIDMSERFFTIVCDFRGGTYVSQVYAFDERHAVRAWTEFLQKERPIKAVSAYLAKSVAAEYSERSPDVLDGLVGAWCISGLCGGDLMLANIIETAMPSNVR